MSGEAARQRETAGSPEADAFEEWWERYYPKLGPFVTPAVRQAAHDAWIVRAGPIDVQHASAEAQAARVEELEAEVQRLRCDCVLCEEARQEIAALAAEPGGEGA